MIIILNFKDLQTIDEQCVETANDDIKPAYIPTQGIDITKQAIGDAGVFRIWDCAGHVEFHVSHSMFLGAENSIFIVVYNLTKELHDKDVSSSKKNCLTFLFLFSWFLSLLSFIRSSVRKDLIGCLHRVWECESVCVSLLYFPYL